MKKQIWLQNDRKKLCQGRRLQRVWMQRTENQMNPIDDGENKHTPELERIEKWRCAKRKTSEIGKHADILKQKKKIDLQKECGFGELCRSQWNMPDETYLISLQ